MKSNDEDADYYSRPPNIGISGAINLQLKRADIEMLAELISQMKMLASARREYYGE